MLGPWSVRAVFAAHEGGDPALTVVDGQHDPVADPVDQRAVAVAGAGQAGGEQLEVGEPLPVQVPDQLGPPGGCVPGQGRVQSAAGQVPRRPGPGRLLPVVVPRRGDGLPRPAQDGGGVHLLFRCGGDQRQVGPPARRSPRRVRPARPAGRATRPLCRRRLRRRQGVGARAGRAAGAGPDRRGPAARPGRGPGRGGTVRGRRGADVQQQAGGVLVRPQGVQGAGEDPGGVRGQPRGDRRKAIWHGHYPSWSRRRVR